MQVKDKVVEQLKTLGIKNTGDIYYNLGTAALYEQAIRGREAVISHLGPLVVRTGSHTGRSPNDKFIVKEPGSQDKVWWGKVNASISEEKFEKIYSKMMAYMQGRDLYIQDCYAGADPKYKLNLRIITEYAWHNLFARNMFRQYKEKTELENSIADFTVIDMPNFKADPEVDGTNSEVFIILNLSKKVVIIGGTSYAGEIKKSIFTVLNYLLPQEKIMSMHCSANVGEEGDVAILFGLSGTGKTTLSADPKRINWR